MTDSKLTAHGCLQQLLYQQVNYPYTSIIWALPPVTTAQRTAVIEVNDLDSLIAIKTIGSGGGFIDDNVGTIEHRLRC